MRRAHGRHYDFIPATYILPEDFRRFTTEREEDSKALWIVKPAASSCGRGIRVIGKSTSLTKKTNAIVQRYIANPHLINGFKYDLRVYVCVTCFDPLRIYIFNNGLVRFATEAYSNARGSVKKRYVHLTNYSV
jgi:tubulin polyglutamylase TTLL4